MSATALTALIAHCRALCRPRSHVADAELLRRFARQRDADAFAQLLERYAALVWGVCRRILPSEADCEDAFQAVFLALLRRPDSVDPSQALGAWLHTVAIRAARKAQVRSQRQRPQAVLPERETMGDVAEEVGSRELFRIVDEEIERLPSALRMPIILCCLEGRTRDEAATILNCSVAAIKGRLERGRNLLRRRLEQRGIQLPAAFLVLGLASIPVRASLRMKAIQSALGSAPQTVAALVPAVGVSLASKLTLTAASLVMVGVLGFGAFYVMEGESPQDTPAPSAATAPPSPQPLSGAKNQPRVDRFGDPLPPGAVHRFGTLRFRHDKIYQLAFTPDGKRLIAGSGGSPLAVFDALTGRRLRVVGKSSSINLAGFALSPDGKSAACCSCDGVPGMVLWDLETGREIQQFGDHFHGVAFSPDGKNIAVTKTNRAEVSIFEAATGKHLADWPVKQGWVNIFNFGQYDFRSLAFSPDGKYLAGILYKVHEDSPFRQTYLSPQVCVMDIAKEGERVRTFGSADAPLGAFSFQPKTGRLVLCDKDGILRFWDVESGKEIHHFSVAQRDTRKKKGCIATALCFSADGRRCAVVEDDGATGLLMVLDAKEGRELRRIDVGKLRTPLAVALSPDGKTVASAKVQEESCVRVWDVASGAERLAEAGQRTPATLSLSADGRTLLSVGDDGRVIHWDLRSRNAQMRPTVQPFRTRDEVGRRIWPRESSEDWAVRGPRWRLTYKKQGAELEVRSLDGAKQLGKINVPELRNGFALSPDGAYLAYAFYEEGDPGRPWHVLVWNPEREKEPRQFKCDHLESGCENLQFTHDGKQLLVGLHAPNTLNRLLTTIWIWDVAAAKIVRKLPTFANPGEMIVSADDRRLITSDAGRIWDLQTGKELACLAKKEERISNLLLSPDERFLAAVIFGTDANTSLIVWETASWKPIRSFASPSAPHSMVFSRDGRSLFAANSDSTILQWDVSGRLADGWRQPAGEKPNRDRLNLLWRTLAATPDKAYPAVWELLDRPAASVPFLIGKLSPVQPIEEKRVRQLLKQLDSDAFAEREEANRQLLALGEQTLPLLRQALQKKPSVEMKKRLEGAIESLTSTPSAEQLRLLRALAVLEWSGAAEADAHLRRLSEGDPAATLTRAAKVARQRRQSRDR